MSAYDNVVIGKLKLKGKALDVRGGGIKKKRKHIKHYEQQLAQASTGREAVLPRDDAENDGGKGQAAAYDYMTPAERRYLQQTEKLQLQKLAKMANKSHRDRVQEFNQYLANLSEHYDIPKVGPG